MRKVAAAWHEHGVDAMFHSDGNYLAALPDLLACEVDGFYCLNPNAGMDIVELKSLPAGGLGGRRRPHDLIERGSPEQVRAAVHRHILATNALQTGGMFVASSSEINPPIKPENFRILVEAVEKFATWTLVRRRRQDVESRRRR